MGYLIQSGDNFLPAPSKESLLEGLPLGTFTVEQSQTGLYFKRMDNLPAPTRLYGNLDKWASRFLNSFQERPMNTGVLLSGEKGSGKSLLGRVVSAKARELSMPTVLIAQNFPGDALRSLLGELSKPSVIFLDEFEKVFNESADQESMLSLLDGTGTSKHLFILTVNDTHRLDRHMKNRPGRLFYSIEFKGLEADFIEEYCRDQLVDEDYVADIVRLASIFEAFNFDMLKALVEEMNRYGETPQEALKLLNITPADGQTHYNVKLVDAEGHERELINSSWYGAPLFIDQHFLQLAELYEDDDLAEWERELLANPVANPDSISFTREHLASFDSASGTYVFKTDGWTITFTSSLYRGVASHWASAF